MYAWTGAMITTGCIAVVWAMYIYAAPGSSTNMASVSDTEAAIPASNDSPEAAIPFSTFWKQTKERFSTAQEEIRAPDVTGVANQTATSTREDVATTTRTPSHITIGATTISSSQASSAVTDQNETGTSVPATRR
jgi:hypothetical protein